MYHHDFYHFFKNSTIIPLIFGTITAVIFALGFSFTFLMLTPTLSNPVLVGEASVVKVVDSNRVDSLAVFKGETVTAEILNAKVGDTISLYSHNSLYTNDSSGHSSMVGSFAEFMVFFVLLVLMAVVVGFALGSQGAYLIFQDK